MAGAQIAAAWTRTLRPPDSRSCAGPTASDHEQARPRRPLLPRGVRAAPRRFRSRVLAHKRNRPPASRPAPHPVLRGPPDDAVPGPGDAAGGAHLRGGGHPRGAGGLQPVHPGRQQLEGDAADRVPGRGGAGTRSSRDWSASSTACRSRWANSRPSPAIADEDLERSTERQDLRGPLPAVRARRRGWWPPSRTAQGCARASITPNALVRLDAVPEVVRESLVADLD